MIWDQLIPVAALAIFALVVGGLIYTTPQLKLIHSPK